ncbi:TPA: YopX family protein [Clostridium perfringens]
MKTIKFRGKSKESNEWVYGFYYEVPAPLKCIGKQDDPKGYIIMKNPNAVNDWGMQIQMVAVEVDRKTVGQYVGINDLENKEIYEGDILEDLCKKRYPVKYSEYKFDVAGFYNTGYDQPNDGFSEGMIFKSIGNIYDNPELEDWN